jgi:hypothetical protein
MRSGKHRAATALEGTVIAGNPVPLLGLVFLEITPEPGPRTGQVTPPSATVLSARRELARVNRPSA